MISVKKFSIKKYQYYKHNKANTCWTARKNDMNKTLHQSVDIPYLSFFILYKTCDITFAIRSDK